MPVTPIIDHPLAISLPSAAYGMAVRLCHHFWQTDCMPLPIAEFELRHIARAHAPTWNRWKIPVMTVVEDACRDIGKYYDWRMAVRAANARTGAKGLGVMRLRANQANKRAPDIAANAAPRKQRGAPKDAPRQVVSGSWAAD